MNLNFIHVDWSCQESCFSVLKHYVSLLDLKYSDVYSKMFLINGCRFFKWNYEKCSEAISKALLVKIVVCWAFWLFSVISVEVWNKNKQKKWLKTIRQHTLGIQCVGVWVCDIQLIQSHHTNMCQLMKGGAACDWCFCSCFTDCFMPRCEIQ